MCITEDPAVSPDVVLHGTETLQLSY